MRRLLVINPNTTEAITALLHRHVQASAGVEMQVQCVTARFGSPYIADKTSYAVGAAATLDAWDRTTGGKEDEAPHAVLIGCFGDPGLQALRKRCPCPVGGLAQAAFDEASLHGRFAIVTGGERWKPILRTLAQALGYDAELAAIHTVAPTGAELAADPKSALALLTRACRDVVRTSGADCVIVGGAGLAGMAQVIQPNLRVPVVDSVLAGARWALRATA